MTYINYKAMREAIKNRQEFNGNSVTAEIEELTGSYLVKSYNTIILEILPNGVLGFNNKRYSVTTSKLQNLIIDSLELERLGYSKKR